MLLVLLFACVGGDEVVKDDTGGESDADTDTDSDTDTDTDTDTDSDTDTDTDSDTDTDTGPIDADADGYPADIDCDDADPAVNPGAVEVCGNGVDDNCDETFSGCSGDEVSAEDIDSLIVGTREEDRLRMRGVVDADADGNDEIAVS